MISLNHAHALGTLTCTYVVKHKGILLFLAKFLHCNFILRNVNVSVNVV